jgi:glycolate oxidase FAD binding subunit
MVDRDLTADLQARVREAQAHKIALRIQGGNSKAFYGETPRGEVLDLSAHTGVIHYEPTELVITARCGTPLRQLEELLDQHNQQLAFDPPHFADNATLGGTLACNFSGPNRVSAGAARDFVLGMRVLNGEGKDLKFGGEVMKNVAGYDVSRLMCGALGTLGVLLEASLKVLPKPEREETRIYELKPNKARAWLSELGRKPLPIVASAMLNDKLYLRFAGSNAAIEAASHGLGGELKVNCQDFWRDLREHRHAFFEHDLPLWRISLDPLAEQPETWGAVAQEWHGALRWLHAPLSEAQAIRDWAAAHGGHATLFHKKNVAADCVPVFHPLNDGLLRLHRNLKQAFDPTGILNPGRMIPGL